MEGSVARPAHYDNRRVCFVPLGMNYVEEAESRKYSPYVLEAPACGLQSGLRFPISLANVPPARFCCDLPNRDQPFLDDSCGPLRRHRTKDALHGKAPACRHLPGLFSYPFPILLPSNSPPSLAISSTWLRFHRPKPFIFIISTTQLWNFEMARHEGCCLERHQHAVSCLAFLDPFPILLSTDVAGCLALWALPPARAGLR